MNGFKNGFVTGVSIIVLICLYSAAHAEFVLQTPIPLTTDHTVRMAVANSGQKVLVSWDDPSGVYFRVSHDPASGFEPAKPVALPPPENIDGLWLDFDHGSVPLMSSSGDISRVLASLKLETDPFFPPPWLPPSLHISFPGLYTSGYLTSVFRYSHQVTAISDRCKTQPGLACSTLNEFDAAMSSDASVMAVVWNAYGLDGQEGDTWFASGEAGSGRFNTPLNLSRLVTGSAAGNDFDPRIVMSADGSRVYTSWTEVEPTGASLSYLSASVDGGANWSPAYVDDDWSASDMSYANNSAELIVAYSTGFYFLEPPASIQVTQSMDDGVTFSAPVTVALKHVLNDGTEMMPTSPVRVSVSADGEVISILHIEEPCDPLFGCLGGSVLPFDVVLSVSENGGSSFERVGVIAQSYFAQSLTASYDIHMLEDGSELFIVTESAEQGASVFIRALRQ